jgi:hypothetical protein
MQKITASVLALVSCAALFSAICVESRASACATAYGRDRTPPRVRGEHALIVFDRAARTEHFIRKATFEGAPEKFGFLVPTPSRPTLEEADQLVFQRLAALFSRPLPRSTGGGGGSGRSALRSRPPMVTVVEERVVAGMQATVLTATDAPALSAWLGQNGFDARPALTAWLAPYVRQRFYVTAFRYEPGSQGAALSTRAVRLSFETDRPFYPYAEPRDAPDTEDRRFVLSVISDVRVAGRVGSRNWSARTGFAGRLTSAETTLRGAVPDPSRFANAWLTTFEEPSSERGTNDLYFDRARDQSTVAPSITR